MAAMWRGCGAHSWFVARQDSLHVGDAPAAFGVQAAGAAAWCCAHNIVDIVSHLREGGAS